MIHSIDKTNKTSLPQITVDALSVYLGVTEDLINNVYVYTQRKERDGKHITHKLHIVPSKYINSAPMRSFQVQTTNEEGWETLFTDCLLGQIKQSGVKSSKFVVIEDEYRLERADRLSKVVKMQEQKRLTRALQGVLTEFAPQIDSFHQAVDKAAATIAAENGVEVEDQQGMPRLPIENMEESTEESA